MKRSFLKYLNVQRGEYMRKVHYYVYCDGILGVKTDISNFKWIYGSTAPCTSRNEYNKCAVKFDVCIKPESLLRSNDGYTKRFQSFMWDCKNQTISYRRTFFKNVHIGYDIKINSNNVIAEIGENYYRFVKKRVMNLHDIYFLLSDLANLILLQSGFLTLYASAVHYAPLNKGIACFAAPSTGKTLTAVNLCKMFGYSMIGEDIIIARANQLHSCPWTASYRKKQSFFDSTGALNRTSKNVSHTICNICELTDMIVLSCEKEKIVSDKTETLRQICVLNGYLFQYYSSPIVKVLGYFEQSFCADWNAQANSIFQSLVNTTQCYILSSKNPHYFSTLVHNVISGDDL